jgi:GTP diphosphokinase / guanosine-3',5'-bis(diphosphate) 3'-diphosphatase
MTDLSHINTENEQIAAKELWALLEPEIKYLNLGDRELVELAFTQMIIAHNRDRRKSGEFYMIHPVSACLILAKMRLDVETLCAMLLHDVPEDTNISLKDLSKHFSSEILFLVEGVTKLNKVKYQGEERYAENLRKMFIVLSKDLRVVLIKLADRIHNLQTLEHVNPQKRYRIALESLQIYAPIAERLGISSLQTQLEDAAFPYVYPEIYEEFVQDSNLEISYRNTILEKVLDKTKKILQNNQLSDLDIYGRSKKYYSIYKKLEDKKSNLKGLHDLVAIRIITKNVADCYFVFSILQEYFTVISNRTKDYITRPKPNGYQSLHLTAILESGFTFEFQVRTQEMHQYAEYGVAAHFTYKAAQRKQGISQYLSGENLKWIKELIDLGKEKLTPEEYLKKVKLDLFEDRIFVLTPKNDSIDLPKQSTPLDFAFRIHEEIGSHAIMAKINGQIAKFSDELNNGDVVEIMIDKRQHPKKDWLNWVKTRSARMHIKSYLKENNN